MFKYFCFILQVYPNSGESSQTSSEGTKAENKMNKNDTGFLHRKDGHLPFLDTHCGFSRDRPCFPTKTSGSKLLQARSTGNGADRGQRGTVAVF